MRTAVISIALGLVGVITFWFLLFLIHVLALGRVLYEPGMLLAPLILHFLPAEWGAGNFGEDSRLLYVSVVNLSALTVWWALFSTGVYLWLRRRRQSKVDA
jgi:putative effector of murein hydrolase LrgA (UPF0299 family)